MIGGRVLEAWVGFVGFHDFGGEEKEDPYAVHCQSHINGSA